MIHGTFGQCTYPSSNRSFRGIGWFRCSSKIVWSPPICPVFRVGHNIVLLLSYRPWLCPFTLAIPSVKLSARREENRSRDVYYRTREIFDPVLLLLRANSTKFNFSLPHRNQHSILQEEINIKIAPKNMKTFFRSRNAHTRPFQSERFFVFPIRFSFNFYVTICQ